MTYDRLTASNAAVLFIDHQTGLANGVQTQSPPEFINNVKALVTIAQIYKLPSNAFWKISGSFRFFGSSHI